MAQHDVNAFQNTLNVVGIKTVFNDRDPLVSDVGFRIPTLWINQSSNVAWLLIDTNGCTAATWIEIGNASFPKMVDSIYDASTAPPVAPVAGDAYLLDESLPLDAGWTAIGATNDDVVIYGSTGWVVYTPTTGDILYVDDIDDFYIYDGSIWELLSGSISGLTYVTFARIPTTADNTYTVPTVWVDSAVDETWILTGVVGGVANWIKLGANSLGDAQDSVLSIVDGNAVPPTEVAGDRYVITDGGGGVVHADWDGASFNDIVEFDGVSWVARTPDEGTFTEVEDVDTVYIFVTAWEKLFQSTGASFATDSGNANPDELGVLNIIGTSAQGLSFAGASNNVTGTIANASDSQKGVASFTLADFDVTTGNVALKASVIRSITTDTGVMTIVGNSISILGGEGMDVTHSGTVITIAGEDATSANKGIASFDSGDFTVTAGDVALNTITVPGGGTGVTSLTDGGILIGSGTSPITATAQPTDGQLLIGSTGNDPVLSTLTAPAAGFTITGGAGSITLALSDDLAGVEGISGTGIAVRTAANTWTDRTIEGVGSVSVANGDGVSGNPTISVTGGGYDWEIVTDAAKTMVASKGYITNLATLVTLTLPASASIGDVFKVVNIGAGFVRIAQNASDQIRFGNTTTTAGVGGYIECDQLGDHVEILAQAANTYLVLDRDGNWDIV